MTEKSPYEGTEIQVVYASHSWKDDVKWSVGIVDTIAGKEFGWYAECGIVHRGDLDVRR